MNDTKPLKVKLTEDIIDLLRAERARTSIGPKALLKSYAELPSGLNHPMVTHWLGRRIKQAKREHLDFVLAAWAKLGSIETVELTDELLEDLRMAQNKSGISAEMIRRWNRDMPDGLSVSKIKHYLSGRASSARADHVEFLKQVWRTRPLVQ